jgi:hypothetical protein
VPDSSSLLALHRGLRAQSRFRQLTAERLRVSDIVILVTAGVFAGAATTWLDFNLRIPGHAILRTVIPLAIGLAMVPRRGSGVVMSCSAALSVLFFRSMGASGGGTGALTSLLLAGPLLDFASHWAMRGWQIYLSFAVAGLTCNLAAYSVRWGTKAGLEGKGLGGGRALHEWQVPAALSYAVCGLLAGLIAAALCFRASDRSKIQDSPP